MVARHDTRMFIKNAFPGHDGLIERAYRESLSFRDLCQDYRNCAVALDRWRRQSGEGPSSRTQEYTDLLLKLRAEVESWLAEADSGTRPWGGVS